VGFGVIGAAVLLVGLTLDAFDLRRSTTRWAGHIVGWSSILVGIAGLFLHLRSTFFDVQTLKSLVYTAPFAAPLSFAGLGFLILLNRHVSRESLAWGQWVVFLAWGGFVGNFALSLADHAQNGFFDAREWVAVAAAALAVGFLLMALLRPHDRALLRATLWVLLLQVLVGILGFVLHLVADLRTPGPGFFQDILFGAPPFAPLLFVDLALLAALGIWDLRAKT
jgi:4-amino-4-deoxy-L-arabinose transferase-like glycosyltransferase